MFNVSIAVLTVEGDTFTNDCDYKALDEAEEEYKYLVHLMQSDPFDPYFEIGLAEGKKLLKFASSARNQQLTQKLNKGLQMGKKVL